tara:strand:+ start:4269 stop:11306 length:7038 start_codon:yes stop_codon:yes gene_type:complete
MALTCPNKNTKEWKRLSSNRPDVDSYIWAKYDGLIPELEYTNPSQRAKFKISNSATDANLSKEQVDSMYEDYSKMMNRKRKGFDLTRDAFDNAFRRGSLLQIGDSKILGEWDIKNNLFKGRVLSSPSIRTLVKDMQDIKSSVNFMASVPPDMGKMLDRLGFVSVEQSKSFDFERKDKDGNIIASEAMEKSLYFSDELLIEKVFGTTKDKVDLDAVVQYDSFFSKVSIMTNIINGLQTNQPANKIADELKKLSIYDQSAAKIIRKYSQFVKDSNRKALIESLMFYKGLYKENKFKQLSDQQINTTKEALISEIENSDLSPSVKSTEIKRINQSYEFVEVINQLVRTIEIAAANKFVDIDTLSAPKVYDEVDSELNKTLVQYLSKFGIKTEMLENIQDELNIDSYATVDILNKILYSDKNNQEELPQKASEFIVYMMQFNPAVTEIMNYMDTKSMFRRGVISKSDKLKAIADLLAAELSKKTGTEIPKTLSDKLKMLFRQFLSFLSISGQARVNRKIGYIADQVLLQNQALITASVFKPGKFGMKTMQVSLQDAIEADEFGDSIINKLSNIGLILVGSTAVGQQGLIKRPNENLLHDIDVSSPFKRQKTIKEFKKIYPNAIKVRSIFNEDQVTDAYLIVPEGYKVENLEMPTINGKVTIQSYDIVNSKGERKGKFRRDKDGKEAKENNIGVQGKVIDLFSYWGKSPDNTIISDGIKISHWVQIFKAKLNYARYKDIWDYNRFIPYDRMEELGITDTREVVSETPNVMNQVAGTEGTAASPQVLEKVKKVLEKMGVKVQDILEYAKSNPAVNISNVNALADLAAGIVAVAEGKEDVALTEEMVHIATAIIEQKNPQLVTEMISKIGRFKIYKDTLAEYRNLKAYQLPNGKPDIRKIKKEAVDKLIAEIIVDGDVEAYTEDTRSLVRRMLDAITDWFRGQYKKANIDIFSETAEAVIGGDFEGSVIDLDSTEIYYQATPQQEKFQRLVEQTKNQLRKIESYEPVDPLLADEEKATSYYELLINGKYQRVLKRVTDRVKTWYRQRFGDTVFSEDDKKDNEVKRELGTKYHGYFEDAHARFFNSDGTRRVNPGPRPLIEGDLNNKIYDKLEKYYTDLIASFSENGKNPLVFSELQVYDKKEKEAGTIDLLIVEEDGTANIYDWKFMSIAKGAEDVAWFKQGAYNVQLRRYKNILIDNYGIKKIGKNRAIPIIMNLKRENFQDSTSKLELKGIKIGSVNPKGIEDLTLTPVSEQSESTGNEKLDDLLEELNAVYNQISKTVTTNDQERLYKIERMNIIKKAMRLLQSQLQMEPLIDAIKIMQREGENIIAEYKTAYEGRPANDKDLTDEKLSEFSANMNEYIASSEVFGNVAVVLGDMVYNKEMDALLSEEEKKKREERKKEMEQQSISIQRSRIEIIKISGKFADKFIGERNLVTGLMNPERIVKGAGALFKSTSEIGLKALDLLFTMANRAMGFANEDSLNEVNELLEIRDRIKAKGGSLRNRVKQIYQKDKDGNIVNHLIYRYNRKFFDDAKSNAAEGRRSKKWLTENIDIDAYKKESNDILKERIRRLEISQPDETLRNKLILEEKKMWDITRPDFNGYSNFVIRRHPLPKWESQEYLDLKKDKDLFDLYNFILKINKKANDTGYLNNAIQSTFLPFVRKSSAERMTWDGSLTSISNFGAKLTVQADEVGYGSINELTGEVENAVPKYYTTDFSAREDGPNDYSDVSMDLFKNMIMYINHSNKYKYLTSIENQLLLVKTQEKFKKHLQTTAFSKASRKDGKVVERKGNDNNVKIIDEFFRNILYGQKYALDDSDVNIPMIPSLIKGVSNIVNTVSKAVTGKEIIQEGAAPTTGSLVKLIDFLNRYVQIKSLGFKSISGAANYFGGNLQISALAGKYFDTREVVKYQGKLLGNRFKNDDERNMFIQLIDTFMPLKDDPTYDKQREAGMSALTRRNWSDILFIWFRQPEQHLEKSIFAALLDNMMVENGKLVNIRDFVKSKYKNRYNSSSEFRSTKSKIDQEISQLKKTRSINAIKKLEDGKLVIPGLDLTNREELQRLTTVAREIARTATGGATEFDNIRANMNVWTKSFMVFKGWIPKLALTRFGEFRKVADNFSVEIDADGLTTGERYDLGRAKMFFGDFTSFIIIPKIKTIIDTLKVTEAGIEKINEMFDKYQKQHEETFGYPANITREDFADLVRSNLRNQIKELVLLISLVSLSIMMGWLAPDDDEDRAAKNKFRYFQKVLDKFISEVSFFYNPAEMASTLDGGVPAIGFFSDIERAITHFTKETTGYDLFKPGKTPEEVRKDAQPVKNIMKLFPVSNSILPILASFDEEFAKEFNITISKTAR